MDAGDPRVGRIFYLPDVNEIPMNAAPTATTVRYSSETLPSFTGEIANRPRPARGLAERRPKTQGSRWNLPRGAHPHDCVRRLRLLSDKREAIAASVQTQQQCRATDLSAACVQDPGRSRPLDRVRMLGLLSLATGIVRYNAC